MTAPPHTLASRGPALEASAAPGLGPETWPERLADALTRLVRSRPLAEAMAHELSIFLYAVAGPFAKPRADARAFTVHEESAWPSAAIGIGFALLAEAFPIHLLVARSSEALAWLLTAASAWGLIWLFGDFQALRHRRLRLTDDAIDLRVGLRLAARVPYAAIGAVREVRGDAPKKAKGTLRAIAIGDPTVVLDLREPIVARGSYGLAITATRIALAPDDRRRFLATLGSHLPAPAPAA